uniref:C-C chemokine receptor type 1-like n=1 Tax=Astyanax mexicanus TaxID=7994 RepID=A0A3B1JR77_ASTMX
MNATTSTPWEITSTVLYNYPNNYSTNAYYSCAYGYQVNHVLTALYSLFFVVGFIGNALVVWVITVGAQLQSMTDVCLLNLALADLLLVLSLPFMIYQINHGWIFGDIMCTMYRGVYYVGFYGGIFFIVLTSIDKYLAIVHAVFALRVRTKTFGIVASLSIWTLAVAASFPELLNITVRKKFTPFCCVSTNFTSFVIFKRNIVGLLVPLIIVGFCYLMVLLRLHKLCSPKKHSMHLVVLIMVVFLSCWTPYNIAEFHRGLQIIPNSRNQIILVVKICKAVAVSHSCLNPFLYVFVGEKYRKHFLKLIRERQFVCCSKRTT